MAASEASKSHTNFELPPELVAHVACQVITLCGRFTRMLRVCQSWRSALSSDEDELWRHVVLESFPRVRKLLDWAQAASAGASALPYRELYRSQLDALTTSLAKSVVPQVSTYHIVVEVVAPDEHRFYERSGVH
jgi:hypothetical protein